MKRRDGNPEMDTSADSPKFGRDSRDCFYETSYDVDSSDCSDYDDYDKLDLDVRSDVWGGIDPSYVPNDIYVLHELHGSNFCGVFCKLYGRFAPTDGELSHAMSDPANYDPRPGHITPESGNVTAMSDVADDIDAELGESSLPSGAHLNMPDVDDIDSASQMTVSVSVTWGCLVCPERFIRSPGVRWRCRISPVTGVPCRRGFTQP